MSKLSSVSLDDLPVIIKFILHSVTPTDALEVLCCFPTNTVGYYILESTENSCGALVKLSSQKKPNLEEDISRYIV